MLNRGLYLCLALSALAGCDSEDAAPGTSGVGGSNGSNGSTEDGGTTGNSTGGGSTGDTPSGDPIVVDADITEDTTWTADQPYIIEKDTKVFVSGAKLTIEAGTEIFGRKNGAIIVANDGQIEAIGTADAPIVFGPVDEAGSRSPGGWAGLALLGNAPINKGAMEGGTLVGQIEGVDPMESRGQYGGDDAKHDCGTLQYVRIEFAGAELSPGNELNGLTLGACGSDTRISYVQVHMGDDDGIEFFGGTADMDHIVISGAQDDSLDWDQGWQGNVQYLVINQLSGGDNGFESDNHGDIPDAEPVSNPTIFNATLIGNSGTRGMLLREGTKAQLSHLVVSGFGGGPLDVLDAPTAGLWGKGLSIENSVFGDNGDFSDDADDTDDGFSEEDSLGDAALNNTFDGSDLGIDPPSFDSSELPEVAESKGALLDEGNTFPGAIDPEGDDWTAGWTDYSEN